MEVFSHTSSQPGRSRSHRCVTIACSLFTLFPAAALDIATDEAALRAHIDESEIRFTNSGLIQLSAPIRVNHSVSISAAAPVTLSGGDSSRIFEIGSNGVLQLSNLTLARGRQSSEGGAVLNWGRFVASDCHFLSNRAIAPLAATQGAASSGGALFSLGWAQFTACSFEDNVAQGGAGGAGSSGGHGSGGAISSSGTLIISNCTFTANHGAGGDGGDGNVSERGGSGGAGIGGALMLKGISVIRSTLFSNNAALGGRSAAPCGAGGPAGGGAIAMEGGNLTLSRVQFFSNQAIGADGASAMIADVASSFVGGDGGEATGSAVYIDGGETRVERCAAYSNLVRGGDGAAGGRGGGVNGTFCNIGKMTIDATTFALNELRGGNGGDSRTVNAEGGNGGHSYGGGLCNMGEAWLRNCTIASNACIGGAGGPSVLRSGGRGGPAGAAAVWVDMEHDEVHVDSCTLAGNTAEPGNGGTGITTGEPGTFRGANIGSVGMVHLKNSICAGPDPRPLAVVNMPVDMGANIIADHSFPLSEPTSIAGIAAGLLPLASNGGDNLTMALISTSPARNRAVRSGTALADQRGYVRLRGPRRDSGAFEFKARPAFKVTGLISDGTNGLPHIAVSVGAAQTITDVTGYFEVFGVPRGVIQITPESIGMEFSPSSQRIKIRRDTIVNPFRPVPAE